jgi:hypothetical protein
VALCFQHARDAFFRRVSFQARKETHMMDVVGVMYNRETGRVRFSLNGIQLPPACHTPGRLYYPVRSVDFFNCNACGCGCDGGVVGGGMSGAKSTCVTSQSSSRRYDGTVCRRSVWTASPSFASTLAPSPFNAHSSITWNTAVVVPSLIPRKKMRTLTPRLRNEHFCRV